MATVIQKLTILLLGGFFVAGMWYMMPPGPRELPFLSQPAYRLVNQPENQPGSGAAIVCGATDSSNQSSTNSVPVQNSPNAEGGVLLLNQGMGYSGNCLRETPPGKNNSKFLIFECTSRVGACGGWGDRQEGLVTVFLLAYLTHRRFGIRMDTPCEVSKFVIPNLYDWVVTEGELNGRSTRSIYAIDVTDFSKGMSTVDFNARYPEDVVFLQTNRDLWKDITINPHYLPMLPSWAKQSRPQFFRDVWHTLMKPAPSVEQHLQGFLESVNYSTRTHPLVCAHVRTGGSKSFADGSFTDRLSYVEALWTFLKPYAENGSEIFIASDNPVVREQSAARFGHRHHDTQVVLRHIDRQRSDPQVCQSFEGAVLDQLILMRCDVLVVSSGSGFSSRAAMIRGTNHQLFEFGHVITAADMIKMCEPIC